MEMNIFFPYLETDWKLVDSFLEVAWDHNIGKVD